MYFNQSQNREWGKEGEGVVLLSGVGGGVGCIGGISRFHLGWRKGVGEGSPYVILRYKCHKGAFYVRPTNSDIRGSEYHPVEARTR